VRLLHEPGFFEFAHHIADRGRAPAGSTREPIGQNKRTHRFPRHQMFLDQGSQHGLRTGIENVVFCVLEARVSTGHQVSVNTFEFCGANRLQIKSKTWHAVISLSAV
jgi:hypothetical protein